MNMIIVGGGQVGAYLTTLLLDGGDQVRLVEAQAERVERLAGRLPAGTLIRGNGSEPGVLESAGVQKADAIAAVTGSDEVNLVVATLARFVFGVKRTIARVNNPKNAWLFTPAMGVDVALSQADLMAHLIAEELSLGEMITLLKLQRGQYALVEEQVHPDSLAAGSAIRDLDLPAACVLIALLRQDELLIPRGDVVLHPGDAVLALVHTNSAARLAAQLAPPEHLGSPLA